MNFCYNCTHHFNIDGVSRCDRPIDASPEHYMITGIMTKPNNRPCELERASKLLEDCGVEARFYEERSLI